MSLWSLFANLRVSYKSAYDCEADGEVFDCSQLDLDPIDVKGCKWKELMGKAVCLKECVSTARGLLEGDPRMLNLQIPRPQAKIPWTAPKWAKHLGCLEEWKVVKNLGKGHISTWVSTYFAVGKSGGQWARSVFSGRKISEMCSKSRPVNLLEIADLLRGAARLSTVNVFTLDLRHWFHQIKISPRLQRIFHVVLEGQTYAWLRLPMGWAWSPYICQCLSWLLLLHKEGDEQDLFETAGLTDDQLPSFLPIKGARGFGSVLYDNFAVFVEDADMMERIQARVERNFALFDVEVKKESRTTHTSKQMRIEKYAREADAEQSRPLPVVLGLEMGRLHHGRLHFAWRISPKKMDAWAALKVPTSGDNARRFASTIGKIVWASHVALEPLHVIAEVLEIARELGREVGTAYKRWDAPFVCDKKQEEVLQNFWDRMKKNTWRWVKHSDSHKKKFFLFTDASDKGWGYVACTPEGVILDQGSYRWTGAHKEWHIFVKETAAAVWAIKRLEAQGHGQAVLFVDNTATQHAIRRGYSANKIACSLIASLGTGSYEVRRIHTVLNPADEPSRGKEVLASKVLAAIADWSKRAITEEKDCPARNVFGLRHVEPDCTEEELDMDDMELAEMLQNSYDPGCEAQEAYRPRPSAAVDFGEGFSIADPSWLLKSS